VVFFTEGFRDLSARFRIAWLWVQRLRIRRDLYMAETQLGLLGWEQAEFYGDDINAHVKQVQDFEQTQAALLNVSAALSEKKAALDAQLAQARAIHDEKQAAIAAERAPVATRFDEADNTRRQKLAAIDRFDRAIQELEQTEKELQRRSLAFMKVANPTFEIRAEARRVTDELARVPGERKIVLADQSRARQEAAQLEPGIAQLRNQLREIDSRAAAVRDEFAAETRRLNGEMSRLDKERKKSHIEMSNLDREKRKPYQAIGACLADDGIGPLNQPEVLQKVLEFREKENIVSRNFRETQATFAKANGGILMGFYTLLVIILFVITFALSHL
jgi:chromosome segregation ATPase